MASKAQEIRMVALPVKIHARVEREAAHRRMTTRDLVAEMVRDYFEQQEGLFNNDNDEDDEGTEWY